MLSTVRKDNETTATEKYQDIANKAGHKLRDIVDYAADETREVRDAVEKQVRSNPVQSTLIAAGVGLFVGLLVGRRENACPIREGCE